VGVEIVLVAEGFEICKGHTVRTACGLGNSMILASQEARMKDCFGHAGMLSGVGLAVGASFQNLSI